MQKEYYKSSFESDFPSSGIKADPLLFWYKLAAGTSQDCTHQAKTREAQMCIITPFYHLS